MESIGKYSHFAWAETIIFTQARRTVPLQSRHFCAPRNQPISFMPRPIDLRRRASLLTFAVAITINAEKIRALAGMESEIKQTMDGDAKRPAIAPKVEARRKASFDYWARISALPSASTQDNPAPDQPTPLRDSNNR